MYTENTIFGDSRVNTILDRILYELAAGVPGFDPAAHIVLTGRAAAELQGEDPALCNNVILLTANADVQAYVQDGLSKKIGATGAARFIDRTIFYFENYLHLEIWYQAALIKTVATHGIYVQDISEINPILL